jgi:hypothetical protein
MSCTNNYNNVTQSLGKFWIKCKIPGAVHDGWDLASVHVHISKPLPSFFLSYINSEGKISEIDNPSKNPPQLNCEDMWVIAK